MTIIALLMRGAYCSPALISHATRASSIRVTIRAWLMWPNASMSDQRTGTSAT